MNKTNDFKYNLPAYSDPVDIEDLNDNFRGIDDALMAGLCKKDYTGNNMGSSDPSARKYAWAPWLEIVNDNEFDVVVTDRNAPVGSEEATINIAAGQTFRKYINGRYYMNFYVQDQHDVTFKWFTNAETYINESGGGGGGTGTVTSVSVQGGSGSHLTGSGNPIETSGTITINVDEGYSIPQTNKQTAWDGKAADLKLEINSSTYVITAQLKDSSGNLIGNERIIDLPLESVVVSGTYDDQTKKVILTLQNGSTIEFSVADLVSGLQTELSSSNKLDPAFIAYDSTHAAVSEAEKNTYAGKQNALTFDDTPTQNSNNPVKSGGIYIALAGKQASLDQTQLAAVNSGIDSTKVAQISTNQSNILYVLGKTGKNLLDISDFKSYESNVGTWSGNTFTPTSAPNITFTINSDYTVTVNGSTPSGTAVTFIISANKGIKSGSYVLSGCPSGGSQTTFDLRYYRQSTGAITADTGSGATITIDDGAYNVAILIRGGQTVSNKIFKPMVCTSEDWAVGQDYVPFTLPNYDLTRLEAEDRAALAEEIDAGAKNLLQLPSGSAKSCGITFSCDPNTGIVTANGTKESGNCYMLLANISLTSFPRKFVAFCNNIDNTKACITIVPHRTNGTYASTIAVGTHTTVDLTSSTFDSFLVRAASYADTGATLSNEKIYPMLCTKAAFGVSQKFVAYCKPLSSKIDHTASLGSVDLNDVIQDGTYMCSPTANSPVSGVSFLQVYNDTSYDLKQVLQKLNEPSIVYIRHRRYNSGTPPYTWTAWYKFTGTVVS